MKLLKLLPLILIVAITQGCNNDEVKDPPPEAPVEKDDSLKKDKNSSEYRANRPYNFTNFELDVDYGVNESYDVSYENEANGMEVDIEDKLNDLSLNGDAAIEQLEPKFKQLTFDQNTQNEEVISEVLKVFDLKDDYTKFELEVMFDDGTEKEYERTE